MAMNRSLMVRSERNRRPDPRSDAERAAYQKALDAQRQRNTQRAMDALWNARRSVRVTTGYTPLDALDAFVYDRCDVALPAFLRRQAQ